MTRTSVAALALLSVIAPASAADLNLPSVLSMKDTVTVNTWTGFYAGANLGYGWDSGTNINSLSADGTTVGAADGVGISDKTSLSGAFGGVELGYNAQFLGAVVGVATDVNISDINDTSNIMVSLGGAPATNVGTRQSVIDWFGSTRLVLGIPIGNLLPYVTGGVAYGGVRDSATIAVGESAKLSSDDTRYGWAAGGGLGMKMSNNWNVKLEYLHYDLGSDSFSGLVATTVVTTNKVDNTFDTVRLGLVYHINP